MAELSNCKTCGTVFVKVLQPLCPQCFEKEEQWYRAVSDFLKKKENWMATKKDLLEATLIPSRTLNAFIRTGRLLLKTYPNLHHPCERCQEPTHERRFCISCATELKTDFNLPLNQSSYEHHTIRERSHSYSLKNTLRQDEK